MAKNKKNDVFPINETNGEATMNNIGPSSLPQFHGLSSKDIDTFMLKFSFVCRTYDYASDDQKTKLLPSTLKDVALRQFMVMPRGSITTLPEMRKAFNKNHRDYCRSKEAKE